MSPGAVRRLVTGGACAGFLWLSGVAAAQAPLPLTLEDPEGRAVDWGEWLAANAPAAVVVWASWAPRGSEVLSRMDALEAACHERGLHLVLVAVQEPLAEARTVLQARSVVWLHDRRGALLKLHRVIQLPALLIMDAKGTVSARLEATPAAVRAWNGS